MTERWHCTETTHNSSESTQFGFQPPNFIIAQHRWEFPILKHKNLTAGNQWTQAENWNAAGWFLSLRSENSPGISYGFVLPQAAPELSWEYQSVTGTVTQELWSTLPSWSLDTSARQLHVSTDSNFAFAWTPTPQTDPRKTQDCCRQVTTPVHGAEPSSGKSRFIWITKHLPDEEHTGFSALCDKSTNSHQYQQAPKLRCSLIAAFQAPIGTLDLSLHKIFLYF